MALFVHFFPDRMRGSFLKHAVYIPVSLANRVPLRILGEILLDDFFMKN